MSKPACEKHDATIARLEQMVSQQGEHRELWIGRMKEIVDALNEMTNVPEWTKPQGIDEVARNAHALLSSMQGK